MMEDRLPGMACVLAGALFEALGQFCFKRAAHHPAGVHPVSLVCHAWRNKWIWAGGLCFLTVAGLWTMALRLLPISIAFPSGAICFVFVALVSRIGLGERIAWFRWIGIALILCGVALISLH